LCYPPPQQLTNNGVSIETTDVFLQAAAVDGDGRIGMEIKTAMIAGFQKNVAHFQSETKVMQH